MRSGHADLSAVEITVLDEADHMADLGFLPGVKRLLDRTPRRCQRLLFSATLDGGVDVLVSVVARPGGAQRRLGAVAGIGDGASRAACRQLGTGQRGGRPRGVAGPEIVFARTKHGAKNLARQLNSRGVAAVELHGNLSQNARTAIWPRFKRFGDMLVATDIAARGITSAA